MSETQHQPFVSYLKDVEFHCSQPNLTWLINKASIIRDAKYILQGLGKIVSILEDKKLVVSCADGFLRFDEYEIFPPLTKNEEDIYLKIGNKLN